MAKAIVGVIGGSGVYALDGLKPTREERVETPWGDPSDLLRFGRLGETEAVFLARHGQGHVHSPSSINYRANIDALKRAGVTDIIAVSACGSFRRELYPGLFVLVDQFIDRTFARQTSFFGTGCVAHVPLAHPVAPQAAPAHRRRPPRPRASPFSPAEPMSAWKARNSPRSPNRCSIRRRAPTSSA